VNILFEIDFYRDNNNISDVLEFINILKQQAETNKNTRINFEKIMTYINYLSEDGVTIGEPIVKHLSDGIYELRPLSNRILFFYFRDNKYVLLSHFVKKSNKTPPREIEKAKRRRDEHNTRYN
jgi:phage-related protein